MTTAATDARASELLVVPIEQRDVGWLRRSLQVAVELELYTLPPYFCGLWTCQGPGDLSPLLQNVTLDEMGHLGQALNLLVAVGDTPTVTTRAPIYPGPLPGGLMPGVTVYLGGMTRDYVALYMQIEHPRSGPLTPPPPEPSIGTFYDAIEDAFGRLNPTLAIERQQDSFVGAAVIDNVDDARRAIARIRDEGEGTSAVPDLAKGVLAHYYRFAEVFNGARLVEVGGVLKFAGEQVDFPDTIAMAPVPPGGWANPPAEVATLLEEFDATYTSLLDNLQRAWETGDPDVLSAAVSDMRFLRDPALQVLEVPLPDGAGNYGPQFRYRG
jgi:hypothetical protein